MYQISNTGLIWSIRRKKKCKLDVVDGRNKVLLYENAKGKIHRVDMLVAQYFGMEEKDILLHLNGNNLDDNLENLLWLTLDEYFERVSVENEQWKMIPEHPKYFVSSIGRVWSMESEKFLSIRPGTYFSVTIRTFRVDVHRLIAKAFIPEIEGKDFVNHKDGNKYNNHVDNLEWVTQEENMRHARDVLGMGSKNKEKYSSIPKNGSHIKGSPCYLVTPKGEIYSLKSKMYISPKKSISGYLQVRIDKKDYNIHELVADIYLPSPNGEKNKIVHIDGNKENNHVDNLEWRNISEEESSEIYEEKKDCTRIYNMRTGRIQKPVISIDMKTDEKKEYDGVKVASRETGVNSGSIVRVCKGRNRSAGGYYWKYKFEQ